MNHLIIGVISFHEVILDVNSKKFPAHNLVVLAEAN